MIGPLLFVGALGALLAYAAWQRHRRPYLFAPTFEAALNEMAQHFRALTVEVGRALIPATTATADALNKLGEVLRGRER